MVEWHLKIGKKELKIRNLEIFTLLVLIVLYVMAATVKEGTWLYNTIASLSQQWENLATNSEKVLLIAFAFATFGNTTVLIVFPYALIVFEIAKIYPNWILLGIISGLGAAVGEVTSYLVGRLIARSKKVKKSQLNEKFHRMRDNFEKKPKSIPVTVFLFALTPLPDDMILVPMGMMKYPYWKSVFPCFLGKTGLCLIMSWLGHVIGVNADFLIQLGETKGWSWLAPILKLFLPSEGINPASDLIQFSLIFIFVYFMVRLDFEKRAMKKSALRKDFEKLLIEGGNFTIPELINRYKIQNHELFQNFLFSFEKKHSNLEIQGPKVHFEEIWSKRKAYKQSMVFAKYLFGRLEEDYYEKDEVGKMNDVGNANDAEEHVSEKSE